MRKLCLSVILGMMLGVCSPTSFADFDPLRTQTTDVEQTAFNAWHTQSPKQNEPECVPVFQSDKVVHVLNLSEVVDSTLCHNSQIKSAWIAMKIQANVLGEARSAYLPHVSGTFTRMSTKTEYPNLRVQPDAYWGNSTYLNLTWRLLDFGERSATVASARYARDAARANHQSMIQSILSEVVNVYFNVLKSKAEMDVQSAIVDRAQKVVQLTLKKEVAGVAAPGDTLQASVLLNQARISVQRAKTEYEKQLAVLKHQMGMAEDIQVVLPEIVNNPTHTESISDVEYQMLLKQLTTHPAVVATENKLVSQRQQVVIARSQALPSVDLFANRYGNGYPGQSVSTTHSNTTTWGFTVNIPIFSGFKQYYKFREMQMQVVQSEVELQEQQRKVREEFETAYSNLKTTQNNLQISLELLNSAQTLMTSANRLFEHNQIDVFKLSETQNALARAKLERIQCVIEWQSARWRFYASIAQLSMGKFNQQLN